jgi:hypothetical protein
MGAAEAIPQDKFDFSPGTANIPGDFKTPSPVRTMAEQFKHIGDALEGEAAGIMGQKAQPGSDENGPKNVKTKQEVIDYLKAAFAKAHSAIDTIPPFRWQSSQLETRNLKRLSLWLLGKSGVALAPEKANCSHPRSS